MDRPPGPTPRRIFRTKPIRQLVESTEGEHALKRVLNPFELVLFGIGAVVGTGIFVITGVAAANFTGPAIVVSFIIAGIVCLFAALCYAEFAAMVPVAGSAYTYSYASLGEIWAWIIGWDLFLEYSVAVAAVAIGWSGYVVNLLEEVGITLPAALVNPPGVAGGLINLPAVLIIAAITALLILGVKESARINTVIVVIKVAVVLLFLYLGFSRIDPVNWDPFLPFGWTGVVTGAAIVFFAYIGFDAVSTTAEEVKNPPAGSPYRDPRLASHRHGAVCRGLPGPHRHCPLHRTERSGTGSPSPSTGSVSPGEGRSSPSGRSSGSPRCCWSSSSARPGSSTPCPVTACSPRSSGGCTRSSGRR